MAKHTLKILKYVRPFYNIMHETVKGMLITGYLRGSWFFVDEGKHVFASALLLFNHLAKE